MSDNGNRVLTVSSVFSSGKNVPMIRLRGEWLRRFGFACQDWFEIVFNWDGSLTLKKINK
jgi:hypothetical protein